MKEEVNSREIKLRWGQNKLKAETESHQVVDSKCSNTVESKFISCNSGNTIKIREKRAADQAT